LDGWIEKGSAVKVVEVFAEKKPAIWRRNRLLVAGACRPVE
jgi:hypothetical protein